MEVVELLIPLNSEDASVPEGTANSRTRPLNISWNVEKDVDAESLVIGALESAFVEMVLDASCLSLTEIFSLRLF